MSNMKSIKPVRENFQQGKDPYLDNIRSQVGEGFTSERIGKGKKTRNEMGKDDFLKLMTAQMKNQDPIHPLKNEEMAAQLAQFSALEQMLNVNQNLEKMQQQQKPQDNILAASLIGKNVVTESNRFNFEKGTEQPLKFDIPKDSKATTVSVVDAKGEIIREIELGALKKGQQNIVWDGKAKNGAEMGKGEYSFRVTATDENETPIQVSTSTAGLVTGVVFENGKAHLIVGDAKIPFDTVNKIENPSPTVKPKPDTRNLAGNSDAKELTKNFDESNEIAGKNVKAPAENDGESVQTKNIQKEDDAQLQSSLGNAKIKEGGASSQVGGEDGGIPFNSGMDLWSPYN
jgi:flagellar basal-body rod modification protein FlgD